ADAVTVQVRAHVRYSGTDTALLVPAFSLSAKNEERAPNLAAMKSSFEAAHKARFGFIDPDKALVVEAVSVEAIGGGAKFSEPSGRATSVPLPAAAPRPRFFSNKAWHDAAVFTRDQLAAGHHIAGPAILIEPHQTIVVEDGWGASITPKNHLLLERAVPLER